MTNRQVHGRARSVWKKKNKPDVFMFTHRGHRFFAKKQTRRPGFRVWELGQEVAEPEVSRR